MEKRTGVPQNAEQPILECRLVDSTGWPTLKQLGEALLNPLQLNQLNLRMELAPMFAVFAFALMLFGITAPREVVLEDDGLFLMNLYSFGVGHPPGYPLYTLLGASFVHLLPDFLPPAYKGHIFSSLAGAVACAAIYLVVIQLVRSRLCALASGLAYAVSEVLWSQAIITEVYTLNAAVYFIVMALCLRYATYAPGGDVRRHRVLYAVIALGYGLGLSNHWPLIGLGGIGLLMIVISQWRSLVTRLPLGALLLAVGLLPYLWLVLRSHSDVPINFYGPIESLERLVFYVSRSGYAGVDFQAGVGIGEKLQFTIFFAGELVRQITPLGAGIALLGWLAMFRSAAHCGLAVALGVAWFMTGPLLIILVDFKAGFIWFAAFRVYHLLCYGITVILFGYGLAWLGDKIIYWLRRPSRKVAGAAVSGLATAVIAASVALHWEQNDRSGYTWARDFALFKLSLVEQDASLFTFDDLDLPVGYLHVVENVRPDLTVFNDQGLVFSNRLFSPLTTEDSRKEVLGRHIATTEPRPVYYHTNQANFFETPGHGSDFLGFWRRVNRDNELDRVVLPESLRLWVSNNINADEIADRWTRHQTQYAMAHLIRAIYQTAQDGSGLAHEWSDVINQAYEQNPVAHLFLLRDSVAATGGIDRGTAVVELRWIDQLFEHSGEVVFNNRLWSDALFLKAQILHRHPELAVGEAAQVFEATMLKSLEYRYTYRQIKTLADFYRRQGRHDEAINVLNILFQNNIPAAPEQYRQLHDLLMREKQEGKLLAPAI